MSQQPVSRVVDEAARAADIVRSVPDPELVVITIGDLGIVRSVEIDDGSVSVTITPTYTACPAIDAIADSIRHGLISAGFQAATVTTVLTPPWTTDLISEHGRAQLRNAGIAPPDPPHEGVAVELAPPCPRCGSRRTETTASFGSTLCKSNHRCLVCHELFEHLKPLR